MSELSLRRDKPPCAKDCPERNGECHATCERYTKWKAAIEADNARERKRIEVEQYSAGLVIRIKKKGAR